MTNTDDCVLFRMLCDRRPNGYEPMVYRGRSRDYRLPAERIYHVIKVFHLFHEERNFLNVTFYR